MRLEHLPDLPLLLDEVLAATMALQRADFGCIQLFDDKTVTLKLVAHRGVGPDFLEHFKTVDASDTSAWVRALKTGERIVVEDVTTDPGYAAHRAVAAAIEFRGHLSTPLFERGTSKPIGMLSTFFRLPYRPKKENLRIAGLLARQAADVIFSRVVEQLLRDSEEHFRLALEAGNMGTWEWDAATHLIKGNKTHQALFGMAPQDEPLPNEAYWARMAPEEAEIGTQRAIDALEKGTDIQLELPIQPSEGVTRWISIQGRPRQRGTGSIIGTTRDITERRNREQALHKHKEWLAAILDQVPGAVGLFDVDGQLLLRGGPLGNLWDGILPSHDPSSIQRWRSFDAEGRLLPISEYPGARALRGETVAPGIDFLHTARDGKKSWLRVSAAPFRDKAGDIAGAVAIMQTVDAEKRAEERLRESESRLQAAVDLVRLGLYSWDIATNELNWDDEIKAMWGVPPDRTIDWDTWRNGIHPDDLTRVDAALAHCLDPTADGVHDLEYRVVGLEDGQERWIATRGQTRFVHGRPVFLLGVALNVTDRKLTESRLSHLVELRTRELKRANASLHEEMDERQRVSERLDLLHTELFHVSRFSVAGQMAAMIAHELSQPLAAIVNSVNAIRRLLNSHAPGAEATVRELTEDVSTQAERAHQILSRLRRFIRRGNPDRVPQSIKPLVEEAVAFATTGSDALGVSTTCYFDPRVSNVLVDRVQIQQVIANLVRNALQAMKDRPRRELKVTTQARLDDFLEIAVTDSGSGVEEQFKGKLFEPFQSTKQEGMGLGLSICETIVESHGGHIKFEPAFGGGSTFSFTIPVAMEAVC